MTRVRKFQQDDAHIFCRKDQVREEIKSSLEFLKYVYSIFGFSFKLFLSTRPKKFMGEISVWDDAEFQLSQALNDFGQNWSINLEDGAFYGPKIDIILEDSLKREFQCGIYII
jgi:threonyl-tRNA synthetase